MMFPALGSAEAGSTIQLRGRCRIASLASVVGPMEGRGPLGEFFDLVTEDDLLGQSSWEKAEREMLLQSIRIACQKADLTPDDAQMLLAGDLLNQLITSGYAARSLDVPYLGLYSACATFVESLFLGAVLVEGGFCERVICATSSHHNTAERQYRLPTEFAAQRPPEAQWTVTGAAAFLLCDGGPTQAADEVQARVMAATMGRVVDYSVSDTYDLGSAMAPAAADTLIRHLSNTGQDPEDFDLILTGDLGKLGSRLTRQLIQKSRGIKLSRGNCWDAGRLIYSSEQKVQAGGSGCACQPVTFAGYIWKMAKELDLQQVLLLGTGALHSPVACQQGESIPAVAHAVELHFAGVQAGEKPSIT